MLDPPSDEQCNDLSAVNRADLEVSKVKRKWINIGKITRDEVNEEVNKLKSLLAELTEQNWTVRPSPPFKQELNKISQENETQRGATGSPPKK